MKTPKEPCQYSVYGACQTCLHTHQRPEKYPFEYKVLIGLVIFAIAVIIQEFVKVIMNA